MKPVKLEMSAFGSYAEKRPWIFRLWVKKVYF